MHPWASRTHVSDKKWYLISWLHNLKVCMCWHILWYHSLSGVCVDTWRAPKRNLKATTKRFINSICFMVAAFLFWLLILCKLSTRQFQCKTNICVTSTSRMTWNEGKWLGSCQAKHLWFCLNFKVHCVPYLRWVYYHWSETQFFILSFSSSL